MERLTAPLVAMLLRALGVLTLNGQRRLGRCLGWLWWRLGSGSARVTATNLALCFPELEPAARHRLELASLQNTAMLLTEAGAVYRWPEDRYRSLAVTVEGRDLLEPADGRGVLVLVPHFGNWEYLALVLGRYRVTALYDPPRIQALETLIRDSRARAGAQLLPIDAGGLRGFYRALAGGGVTALLPDQVPDRSAGVYSGFFGHRALTMTFVHRLLQRTRPHVVLGAAVRCVGGFRVRFVVMDEGRLGHADPAVSTAAMNEAIEALVRSDPAQYQWEYKRFKRPPPGCRDPYTGRSAAPE